MNNTSDTKLLVRKDRESVSPHFLEQALPDDLASIRELFEQARPVIYQGVPVGIQSLAGEGGEARFAHDGEYLHILMELADYDIYNHSRGHNVFHYRHGDVAEVFISIHGTGEYFEIHLTPNGDMTEMQWSEELREQVVTKQKKASDALVLNRRVSTGRTWIDKEHLRWFGLVSIPLQELGLNGQELRGKGIDFSLSRYNYTSKDSSFVLSSTSPHAVSSFHIREDWQYLFFGG